MGWWSKAVMGGDGPYDTAAFIEHEIASNMSPEDLEVFEEEGTLGEVEDEEGLNNVRAGFTKALPVIFESLDNEDDVPDEIGYQVLGVIMMAWGMPIEAELRAKIITYAQNDSWAQEDEERAKIMKSYIADLEKYDNATPTTLTEADQGLFAAIEQHLDSGEEGLVNKKGPSK